MKTLIKQYSFIFYVDIHHYLVNPPSFPNKGKDKDLLQFLHCTNHVQRIKVAYKFLQVPWTYSFNVLKLTNEFDKEIVRIYNDY